MLLRPKKSGGGGRNRSESERWKADGIARRIEQVSEQVLQLNEGTVYTSLLRLQQRKWISAEWGASENNRKAKYYSITKSGRKQLARETENWERIAGVIGRLLKLEGQG